MRFSSEKVDKRIARETERPDIWTYVMRNSHIEGHELALTELHSNGASFMVAGTETTATELSGLTYMLLKNPEKLDRLTKEVRGAFKTFEDVTMVKLSQLEYLQACIEEGLRMYPPVPVGLPRITPEGGAKVCNRWIPGGVSDPMTQILRHSTVSDVLQ
jgi:cytochrome P450